MIVSLIVGYSDGAQRNKYKLGTNKIATVNFIK